MDRIGQNPFETLSNLEIYLPQFHILVIYEIIPIPYVKY